MSDVFTKLSKLRHENEDLIREVKHFKRKIAELEAKCECLLQQAQGHHYEDNIHKSIQFEIYQALGIQKGDWNGAVPVIEKFRELEADKAKLEASLELAKGVGDGWLQTATDLTTKHAELVADVRRALYGTLLDQHGNRDDDGLCGYPDLPVITERLLKALEEQGNE